MSIRERIEQAAVNTTISLEVNPWKHVALIGAREMALIIKERYEAELGPSIPAGWPTELIDDLLAELSDGQTARETSRQESK